MTQETKQLPAKFGDPKQARVWITKFAGELDKMLSNRIPRDLFISTALSCFRTTPKLLECTTLSVLGGIFEVAQLGLVFGGVQGQAFLVPYKGIATLQIGYKAYPAIARREGATLWAHCVWEGEEFDYRLGSAPSIVHVPRRGIPRVAKDAMLPNLVAAYCVIRYASGDTDFEVLDRAQVMKRRECSQPVKRGNHDTPWFTAPEEMARKCPIHALGKRSGLLAIQRAATVDEYGDTQGARQDLHLTAADVLNISDIPPDQLPPPVDDEPKAPTKKDPLPPDIQSGVAVMGKRNENGSIDVPEPSSIQPPTEPKPKKRQTKKKPPAGTPPAKISDGQRAQINRAIYPAGASDEQRERSYQDLRDWMEPTLGITTAADATVDQFDELLAKAQEIGGA